MVIVVDEEVVAPERARPFESSVIHPVAAHPVGREGAAWTLSGLKRTVSRLREETRRVEMLARVGGERDD